MHIVVIGGGVVGVTTARELIRRGHRVTVLERHPVAGNETSKGNAAQRSYGVVYPWARSEERRVGKECSSLGLTFMTTIKSMVSMSSLSGNYGALYRTMHF